MHRVQRVPVTESQGRVHTSAAGVLVLPEAEQVDVTGRRERPAHRRLPQQRARRPERQHHRLRRPDHARADRASSSAARTRRASCRTASRRCASCAPGCWPPPRRRPTPRPSDARRSQVRTVDRSERIRTYNYAENRISDHRTGYKAYNLDQVLDGDLQPVIESCVEADLAARLEAARPVSDAARGARWRAAVAPAGRGRRGQPRARRRRAARPRPRHRPRPPGRSSTRSTTPTGRRTTPWSRRRAAREPLQHLTGRACFRHVELAVGPGVFVPRPETELLAGWADRARPSGDLDAPGRRRPRAPAPGAIAKAVADEVPDARVHAVELDEPAHALGGAQPRRAPGVDLRLGDIGHRLRRPAPAPSTWWSATRRTSRSRPGSRSPPRPATTTRTSRSSPATTGWTRSGCWRVRAAALLLRPGGVVGVEHADVQGESAPAVLRRDRTVDRGARPPRPGGSSRASRPRGWHDDPVRRR